MRARALIVAEPSVQRLARDLGDRLGALGLCVAHRGFDVLPSTHETADLVVLGASASLFRSRDGEALRSWLMTTRAAHQGQRAAAFELRHGRAPWRRETTAVSALRAMSAHGFRLAALPLALRVADELGTPAPGEPARLGDWAADLAEAMSAPTHLSRFLVGSGQGH